MFKSFIDNLIYKTFNKITFIYQGVKNRIYSRYAVIGEGSSVSQLGQIVNMTNDPSKITIGKGTHIDGQVLLRPYGKQLSIGDNCYVGRNSCIWCGEKIEIGSNVLISHNVNIIDNDSHEIDHLKRAASAKSQFINGIPKELGEVKAKPIVIKDYAWLSYNVSVLKGVTIGEGAIIGCGSVVTTDIPDFCVAVGNPAKVIKKLEHEHI